jgi:hypothetical protein
MIFLAILLIALIVGSIIGVRFVYATVDYVVDNLASRSGLSTFLVRGVVILATIPFFWAIARFTRFDEAIWNAEEAIKLDPGQTHIVPDA